MIDPIATDSRIDSRRIAITSSCRPPLYPCPSSAHRRLRTPKSCPGIPGEWRLSRMPNSTIPKILNWRSSNDATTTTSHRSRLLFSSNLIHPVSTIHPSLSLLFHFSSDSAHFYVQRALVPRDRHIPIRGRGGPTYIHLHISPIILKNGWKGSRCQLTPGN